MRPLDRIVYVLDGFKIIEAPIRDFSGYIDETTTPHGVAPRYHVRGNELWTWGHQGNFPRRISIHDTEEEAELELEETFACDFWNAYDTCAFPDRESAEAALEQAAQDREDAKVYE